MSFFVETLPVVFGEVTVSLPSDLDLFTLTFRDGPFAEGIVLNRGDLERLELVCQMARLSLDERHSQK